MPALALIFHLIDGVDAGTRGPLSRAAAAQAAAWCEYLAAHAPPALRGRHRRGAGGGRPAQAAEAEVAARALGLQVQLMEARSRAELDSVFTSMVREKLHAALVQPSQMIFAHRTRIAELAAKNRLPTMGIIRWFAEAGGLMSYGARDIDQFQRAAYYVHKILKGANPADLPIEQPTRFEIVINQDGEGARPHDPAVAAAANTLRLVTPDCSGGSAEISCMTCSFLKRSRRADGNVPPARRAVKRDARERSP